jgi:hypothetical protein
MCTYAVNFRTPKYDNETEFIKAQSAKQARRLFVDQFGDVYDGFQIISVEPYETMDDVARTPGSAAWCESYGDNRD